MPAFTTLALVATAAVGAASVVSQNKQAKEARKQAQRQAAAELAQREALASQAKAPIVKGEGIVELQSAEALEEEEIRLRSKRGRLRVGKSTTPGLAAVGTGLKVG